MRTKAFHPAKNRRVINDYFIVPERLGDGLESLGKQVILNPDPDVLKRIFNARVNTLVLRRAIWSLRGERRPR